MEDREVQQEYMKYREIHSRVKTSLPSQKGFLNPANLAIPLSIPVHSGTDYLILSSVRRASVNGGRTSVSLALAPVGVSRAARPPTLPVERAFAARIFDLVDLVLAARFAHTLC